MRFSDEFGFYELNPFPGSNQIVVSNHAFIYPKLRGQGYGSRQHRARLNMARNLGYDVIMCTVREDNAIERHILFKFGWNNVLVFNSTETGHKLCVYTRKLTHV
jgi:Acetyltransferases, including N-acetylases of ribosomal proteins